MRMKDIASGAPITGFVGINGVGKTLLAVESAISDMSHGRPVFSTVPIVSEFGSSEPIRSLGQLGTLRGSTILLDEVAVIFSSRTSSSLPPEMVTMLQTLRHRDNRILWTAPGWMRADNLLREVTQAVVSLTPFVRGMRSNVNPWPRPHVVMAGVLDTSVGKADAVPTKVLRRRFFVPSRLVSYGTYDTMADTPQLGMTRFTGRCECGGDIPRPKHTAERHAELGLVWDEPEITPKPSIVKNETARTRGGSLEPIRLPE